ncbi:MAG: M56 family metallopeptidase [Lachnospiraceae bacterium]|nr:M56 family metallopeptidase [Lachnospiraceae bacterium]
MDWISNLFVVLLLADVAGTIFFLIGELLKRTPLGRDIRFQRFLMDATLCAFVIPFVYFAFYLDKRIQMVGLESEINLFYTTPSIRRFNTVLGCIWIGLFLVLLSYRLYRRHRWTMICKGNIPEEDEAISKVFEDVSEELGISGKVSLCRNDSIDVPCITYHHGFVVMLPLLCYTEEEAKVIFYHELCHYLNHDVHLKTIGCVVALLHVFNPAAHILLLEMELLCEKCCDIAACKKGKVTFTREEYLQTILNMLLTDGRRERYRLFALVDGKSNYERRVKYMLDYHEHGGMKKGVALVVAACFLLGSSTSSLAAGSGVAMAYQEVAANTSVREYENVEDMSPIPASSNGVNGVVTLSEKPYDLDPDKVVIMDDEVAVGPGRETRGITWTIPPQMTYMTSGFKVKTGDKMTATIVPTPDDLEFEAGFKDGKNIMHGAFLTGTSVIQYTVDEGARHYFYISNLSETEDLHIEATVIVTEKVVEETE